ncbi:type II secretion system protein [Rubellicoccus peritrichatus]|uniref:Type II secretion system protein n=1 Tax=Rubellicoccus peritrichatus TaxID=3080537 RepID=A0AAQ3LGD4_9BACT|nr:type II secretion system protein [Puniceicoccus sp. CR14]WOO43348.1 type II secretion system protein [Puniceicoccus sp. CR14]
MKPKPTGNVFRGFTLVEILVTLSIVLLLAAILIPITSSVRSKAWKVEATTRMRSIHQAIMLSQIDEHGRFPLMKNYDWDGPVNPAGDLVAANYPYMQEKLAPYLNLYQTNASEIQEIFRNPIVESNETPAWLHEPGHTHFRYNVMTAPGNYMVDDNKAIVVFDVAWPDWPSTDFPYQDGGEAYMNVVLGSGTVSPLTYDEYIALHNDGESVDSPFFTNGWAP